MATLTDGLQLITDRTLADVNAIKEIIKKGYDSLTEDEKTLWLNGMKGAYNYTDLNRVTAATEMLKNTLEGYGYSVPGYKRIEIPHKGSGGSSRLPAGHTELKWIESTGTQYVDSGFVPNQDTRFVGEFEAHIVGVNSFPFGVRTGLTKGFDVAITSTQVFYNYGNQYAYANFANTAERMKIDANKNTATFVGTQTVAITLDPQTFAAEYNLIIGTFADRGVASTGTYAWNGKIFPCQIYDNGTLIRDYIPDMTDDGQVGLYDLVEGKFYPNAGTGVFLAGPRRVQLPEGYTQVEYIESTGTQYIDTAYKPNSDTRTVLDIENTYAGQAALFGARDSGSANSNLLWAISETAFRSDYFASTTNLQNINVDTVTGRYTIDKNKNVCTAKGVTATNNAVTFSVNYSMFLFTLSNAGTPNSIMAKMKLYSCQIYDNGTLVRDYVPCVTSAGDGGLYDLVTSEFYGNAGTGSFIAGSVVEWDFSGEIDEEKNPYLWYASDIPTPELMADYLSNVSAIRSVLEVYESTPTVPVNMARLTVDKANAIEQILVDVQTVIVNMVSGFARSNSFDFWSGNRPIPTAKSDVGRNWESLDAMGSTWANWQEATWYLLLYGNLKAEGVV